MNNEGGKPWAARDASATLDLDAGNHALVVEYFQGGETGSLRLEWSSARIGRQVIASSYLVPVVKPLLVSPLPAAMDVSQSPRLIWTPTDTDAKHDVYLNTSYDAVASATPASANVYQGQVDGSTIDLSDLAFGQEYFWRVDSVNGAVAAGRIWHFTVADCLVIDDFERYLASPDEETLWWSWLDGFGGNGSGSEVVQQDIGSARQSMLVLFDNDGSFESLDGVVQQNHSEAEREFADIQDWTQVNGQAAGSLGLTYRGVTAQGIPGKPHRIDNHVIQAPLIFLEGGFSHRQPVKLSSERQSGD